MEKRKGLTKHQAKILEVIANDMANGNEIPTLRRIAELLDKKENTTNGIRTSLERMAKNGFIVKIGSKYKVVGIPVYTDLVETLQKLVKWNKRNLNSASPEWEEAERICDGIAHRTLPAKADEKPKQKEA